MFNFGDDLLIGSHRIPWLVWIQLVVTLLLIVLLYYFIAFALGLDPSPTAASSSPAVLRCESSVHTPPPIATAVSAAFAAPSRANSAKADESFSIKGDVGTSTSRRRARREEIQEREGNSLAKDANNVPALDRYYHPCYYLGWARNAFLKCLGLDPTSSDPFSNTRHKKEK